MQTSLYHDVWSGAVFTLMGKQDFSDSSTLAPSCMTNKRATQVFVTKELVEVLMIDNHLLTPADKTTSSSFSPTVSAAWVLAPDRHAHRTADSRQSVQALVSDSG